MGFSRNIENLNNAPLSTIIQKSKTNVSTTATNISFDVVIEKLKASDNILSKTTARSLESLKKILSGKNEENIKIILQKLYDAKNYTNINKYIGELNKIAEKYKEDFKKRNAALITRLKLKAESIKNISIGEDFEVPKELDDLLEQYDDAIFDLKRKKFISFGEKAEQYESAIKLLEKFKKAIEQLAAQTSQITGEDINKKFNTIVDKIINSPFNGPITIDIFGVQKTFKNKEVALEVVEKMKIELSEELVSGVQNLIDFLKFPYTAVDSIGIFDGAEWLLKDGYDNITDLDIGTILGLIEVALGSGLGLIGISAVLSIGALPFGVAESVYRRGYRDPRAWFNNQNTDFQYEDYGKTGNTVDNFDTPEGKDYLEYKQRQGLMDYFYNELSRFDKNTPEYKNLEKAIKVLNNYKLNKTNTFYMLANKVAEGMELGIKGNLDLKTLWYNINRVIIDGWRIVGYNPLKKGKDGKIIRGIKSDGKLTFPKLGGFSSFQIDRSQNLYKNTIELFANKDQKLKEGLELFYQDPSVKTTVEDKILKTEIEVDTEKTINAYKNIFDYIKTLKIGSSKKEEISKKVKDYIENLGKNAKYPKQIYRDISSLINLDFDDPKKQLKKLYEEIEELEKKYNKKFFSKVKNKFSFFKGDKKIQNYKEFVDLIERGEWLGTKEEFEKALKDIDSGNEIKSNIETKLGTSDFKKIFEDIIKKGGEIFEEHDRLKLNLFDSLGDSVENSNKKQFYKNIEDFIGYKIEDNKIEDDIRKRFNSFIDTFFKDEIIIGSEEKLNIEIGKILNGGLTEYELINKLEFSIKNSFSDEQKNKIKDLIEELKSNDKIIVTEKELNEIINKVIKDEDLSSISFSGSREVDLTEILNKINESQDLREKDFIKQLSDIGMGIDDFFDKVNGTINLDDSISQGDKRNIIIEIGKLKNSISLSKYTDGQILFIIEEIKKGNKYNDISKIDEIQNKNLSDLIIPKFKEALKNKINDLYLKISYVGDDLDKYEKLKEEIEKIKKNEYFKYLTDDEKDNLVFKEKDLETEFNDKFNSKSIDEKIKYLELNKNNINNPIAKSKITDFIEKTISEINNIENISIKVDKAKELKLNISNELYIGKIQTDLKDLISEGEKLSNIEKHKQALKAKIEQIKTRKNITGLDRLEESFNEYLDKAENNINRDDFKDLIQEFEEKYNSNIEELKLKEASNSSPEKTTLSLDEILEKKKADAIDLLSRAKLEGLLRGIEDLSFIDKKIDEITNMNKNIPTLDVLKDDLLLKGIVDIRDRDSIRKELVELNVIKNTLKSVAKTKKLKAIESYRGRSFYDDLVKYISKSIKTGG